MLSGLLVAFVGLASAILGGALQACATGRFEKSKFERQAKWELYSAFFASLGELSFYPARSDRAVAALAAMAQIRARIAIYGSDEVIQSVAKVFHYKDLGSEEAQMTMAAALAAMRRDTGQAGARATPMELKEVMFSPRQTSD